MTRRFPVFVALAAVLVAISALGLWIIASTPATWRLSPREGRPTANGRTLAGTTVMHEGEWVETDDRSRARLLIPRVGWIDVGYGTRLQVGRAGRPDYRVVLERGRVAVRVTTSPALFRLESAAAKLIGYGGAYTLEIGPGGVGTLRVGSGWAALEWRTRQSVVPAGAACPLRADGPGTPYFEDASAAFREALDAIDTRSVDSLFRRIAIDVVLTEARPRDALTLWHLGSRVESSVRGAVLDRLAALAPPPAGVTRDGMIDGDAAMRERWFASLGLGPAPWSQAVGR